MGSLCLIVPDWLAHLRELQTIRDWLLLQALPEPQWLKIDIRTFNMKVLGKFGVIMSDPPWEIHQDLPYGTMADDEMRKMQVSELQDDGVIFLWVTGMSTAAQPYAECVFLVLLTAVAGLIYSACARYQHADNTSGSGICKVVQCPTRVLKPVGGAAVSHRSSRDQQL